jgi:hypothetical protein
MIEIWVIYRRPTDFPHDNYVMRKHHIDKGDVTPTDEIYTAKTIAEIRRKIPSGTKKSLPTADDEPQIVEWWF